MSNVAGIFRTRTEAEFAFAALIRSGFTKDNISLLISEESKAGFFGNKAPDSQLADEGLGGAITGATLGTLFAGLASIGTLVIPGINVLAVGPLAAMLIGAQAGGIVGGLSGLINADLANEKKVYDEAIKQGRAVLIVNTETEAEEEKANNVLSEYTPLRKVA